MAPSILDASPETPVDRRRIMRYALGAVAGAVALPVLAACGTTKAANSSATSTSASGSTAPAVKLLPATGTPSWPVDVATAQPTAPWSMYATKGSGSSMLLEMVTYGNDMWNDKDNFSYFAQQASGAGEWSAQVAFLSQTDSWAKAGIMIRQTLDAGSTDYYFVTTVGNGASLQYRPVADYGCSGGPTVNPLDSTPVYLKMQYTPGKQIAMWDSTDGKTWGHQTTVPLGAGTIDSSKHAWVMAKGAPKGAIPDMITGTYYVGVCAASHNPSLQGYAGFTNFGGGLDTSKLTYTAVHQSVKNKGNY